MIHVADRETWGEMAGSKFSNCFYKKDPTADLLESCNLSVVEHALGTDITVWSLRLSEQTPTSVLLDLVRMYMH